VNAGGWFLLGVLASGAAILVVLTLVWSLGELAAWWERR
jgi:hypothetical protein